MKKNKPCAVFVANRGYAFTSSRLSIIRKFISSDWEVVVATADDVESRRLREVGAKFEEVLFYRGGVSPKFEISAYRKLYSVFAMWRPSLIHHFHAKPVVYGTIAARKSLRESVRIVNTITGLGHAFVVGGFSKKLAGFGYRKATNMADLNIFQNRDDLRLFLDSGWVTKSKSCLVAGSGVDIKRFYMVDRTKRDSERPIIVMLGRLLRQKGIPEFVEIAQKIKKNWPGAKFFLAGEKDPAHPDSVDMDWLLSHREISYLGRLDDVLPILERSDMLLFPSYREGVPRVILEAAAMGLPSVGFDVPGVREAVRNDETGYLVPFRDMEAMTNAVIRLLQDSDLRLRMGRAARKMIESRFDKRLIEDKYFALYRELGIDLA